LFTALLLLLLTVIGMTQARVSATDDKARNLCGACLFSKRCLFE